jgi:hypothetical protein
LQRQPICGGNENAADHNEEAAEEEIGNGAEMKVKAIMMTGN